MSKRKMHPRSRAVLISLVIAAVLAGLVTTQVKFKFTGRWEGIFLLKGRCGKPLELKDDLYLGDGYRLIASLPLWWTKTYRADANFEKLAPCLYYEWDEEQGKGFVHNYLPGGRRISTCFSRFNYAQKQADIEQEIEVHGLFVGGGLPVTVSSNDESVLDETGMAYWNGSRWYHIWCSVNEGISTADTKVPLPPSGWKFLGSRVLNSSPTSLTITSAHEIPIEGHLLRMDRYAYFRAGNTYFLLSIFLENIGSGPASFYYTYGDEPWLGNFGSSEGNVGWVRDRLITDTSFVDTDKYSYAGFFDYGNKGSHDYTWAANFIEWFGDNTPGVYFSNGPSDYPPLEGTGAPLTSDERFMGLQWGPITLQPGQNVTFVLAIGMAGNDPATGFPVKPEIKLKRVPRSDMDRSCEKGG